MRKLGKVALWTLFFVLMPVVAMAQDGHAAAAREVNRVVDEVLSLPEHAWFLEGAEGQAERIRLEMERRYGRAGG